MEGKKKISQQKIAQELGVSQSLVSIVLNGRKDGISETSYKRIWDYAIAHGYQPKGMRVASLPNSSTHATAMGYFLRAPLKLANTSNFFSHIAQGLHEELADHESELVFLGSETDYQGETPARLRWQESKVRGVVILGEVNDHFLQRVRRWNKPMVYLSARAPGVCHSVNSNEWQAAELLVEHLAALGHRHFAYFGGKDAASRSRERIDAFRGALQFRDLPWDEKNLFLSPEAERAPGYEMAQTLLSRRPDPFPTAWVCMNGLIARGAVNRLHQVGLVPGKHVSVVAFDRTRVVAEEKPAITAAAAEPEEMGREAARLLVESCAAKGRIPLQDIVLPAQLSERETSGEPAKIPLSRLSS